MEGPELNEHAETAKASWDKSEHKVILLIGEHNVKRLLAKDLPHFHVVKVEVSDVTIFYEAVWVWLILFDDGEDIEMTPHVATQECYGSRIVMP